MSVRSRPRITYIRVPPRAQIAPQACGDDDKTAVDLPTIGIRRPVAAACAACLL
jgi:hypothetical protein